MNISGMIRGLIGETQLSEPKSLELKAGQVVKGKVVQLLSDKEALVQINGVQVRAQLEAPLKQGEVTMLQVQPESSGGQVMLKPLQSSTVQIADVSLGDVLKGIGLQDTPANRQLVQMLHQAGVQLTRDHVYAFVQLRSGMPAQTPPEDWVPAAVIAFQKGLPLTSESVASLRQAVQGPPFHKALENISLLAQQELDGRTEYSPQTRALLEGVRQLVQQLRETAGQLLGRAADGGEAVQGASSSGAAGAGAQQAAAEQPPAAMAQAQTLSEQQEDGPLLGRLMKALGMNHEHQAIKHLEQNLQEQRLHAGSLSAGSPGEAAEAADSLKSVLMQLSQAMDAPQDLKDAARQAVQQITGQQLLLSQDRGAMFSHVTLFVPLIHANGEQTAAIHIQSRKGRNGSLDESNCRLVFDLRMKALGDTLVDVQVVNRIVSLHVHNDLPFTRELLDAHKDDIAQGLHSIGYQFISMKCSPYPSKATENIEFSESSGPASVLREGSLESIYAQRRYKGVDIRV
ncbi:hypothetical protein [Paenibacillus sp. Pae108]|uniref:hypothetical protein n=1 Tax=Paenibacillus sp. Pae108 TaxID=2926019 RepID=UPI00211738AE|nr:hypothetical protein [Paenibacillus sp. Pae108]